MSNEILYFKIKHAFLSTWTLEQAAYLLLGYNPNSSEFEIYEDATNTVSNLYYWLKEKAHKGEIIAQVRSFPMGRNKKPWRYSPDQLFDLMDAHKREYNQDIFKIRSLLLGETSFNLSGTINKTLYKRAAELIWRDNDKATIPEVAEVLVSLPEKLNSKYSLVKLPFLEPHQIKEHLKGMSPNKKGAPKKEVKSPLNIDWSKLLENL